jgi:hypothetical protein
VVLYDRPVDLSADETMRELLDAIERIGAKAGDRFAGRF